MARATASADSIRRLGIIRKRERSLEMKLTPLDIHHKEFRNSLRGYNVEEVDKFLDEVADEFERLFKENIDLSERLDAAREQIRGFEAQKETLHNTLVAAQRSAEDITLRAKEEAATVLRDAEVKAKEIIHNALTQKQAISTELVRIKKAEEEFRVAFKQMLESHLKSITAIPLSDDVQVLMGQTGEGTIADVKVGQPASQPPPHPVKKAPLASSPSAPERIKPAITEDPAAESISIEPPASGFVQSIALGELDEPDLSAEEPVFEDPKEFQLGSLELFGERDEDSEIEKID